jgi:pyruvate, water dikinase
MYTKWLNQTNHSEIEIVGGKNASLGEMISNLNSKDIQIPNGFVISAISYQQFINNNNLNNQISNLKKSSNIKETCKNIRDLITRGNFPLAIEQEIISMYQHLSHRYQTKNVDVAVRSSSTAEDMPDASFAGQQDTYLNVTGEKQLLHYVKKCFASLFNHRAVSYRNSMGYGDKVVKLSICVQKMVRSDLGCAGVAFSIDGDSGNPDVVVINGSYGLGEMVVSGQVNPDEFVVFKKKLDNFRPIIDKKLGKKDIKMVYSDSQNTQIVSTTKQEQSSFCLNDDQILQLSKWVVEIEKYYSQLHGKWTPMDVEWAVDGTNNQLYIVQARPETVISKSDSNYLIEYSLLPYQSKDLLVTGTAIGDKISTGKVKIIDHIDSPEINDFCDGDILVTSITDPDWEPIMKRSSAIVTEKGGRTCHAAIVARELGVNAIVGASNCLQILQDNQNVTVCCAEGDQGFVYHNILKFEEKKIDLSTLPKINTKLMMNVGSPSMAYKSSRMPNDGVGLARQEFIINNFIKVHPLALINYNTIKESSFIKESSVKKEIDNLWKGFDSPVQFYIDKLTYGVSRIASAFYPKDVIVRFSDFKSNEYRNLLGGNIYEPHEENPMIGWRGASRYYSENFEPAFELECLAIKKAREEIGLDNIIVMIPFCRTLSECSKVLNVMKKYGLTRGQNGLKVYLMCEIPSNVILAEQFCQLVDGFSIGSNDLTQLTLGLDRDSELVSYLYDERNQAVTLMLSNVIRTCKKNGVKIGICGQGPSDFPDFAAFLVSEKIDSISVVPDSVIKTTIAIKNIEMTNQSKI